MFSKIPSSKPSTQSPPQARPPGDNRGGGGGFPWGKVLAGCGCLTLVALLVAGGVGYWLYSAGKEKLNDEEGGFISALEDMSESSGSRGSSSSGEGGEAGAASSGSSAKGAKKKARKAREEALSHKKLREYVRQPLTKSDVEEYKDFVKQWRQDKAYKNWNKQWKAMKARSEDKDKESMVGQLKTARQTAKTMTAVQQVWKAYDEHIRQHGGYEKQYGRMTRVGGLIAAADAVAKEHKIENANSDKVAEKILEQRPEVAKEYQKNVEAAREAARAAKESGDKDAQQMASMQGLMTMMSSPGAVAMARMPEESFETWAKMSEGERKELRELMKTSVAPGPYFSSMFGGNPASLLVAAYMAELRDISNPDGK